VPDEVLAHERITAPDAAPAKFLYVLHGVYGSGRNWASVVRRVLEQRPEWGALLVDLRQHGASQGFEPPHTIEAAAADVAKLAQSAGMEPAAVLGHSFGGKVALAYSLLRPAGLRQVWVIDSTPAAREPSGSAWEMLDVLRDVPPVVARREDLVAALEADGVARPIAQWLATNLQPAPGGYRWQLDLDSIEELLRDFFRTDVWPAVENPAAGVAIHIVKAEQSSVLDGEALARVERAAGGDAVLLHRIAGGHWVNTDNPAALIDLLVTHLP
jgi:esterase